MEGVLQMKRFELVRKFGFLSLTAFIVFSITTLPVKAFYNEENGFYEKVNFIENTPKLSLAIKDEPSWKETLRKNTQKLSVIIEEAPDWKETFTEDVYKADSDIEYTYTYDNDTEYTYMEDINTEDNDTEYTYIKHSDI